MLNPLSEIRYLKNSKRLMKIVSDLISNYEKDGPTSFSSCKTELEKHIMDSIKDDHDNIATWEDYDTDYITIAHSYIIHTINWILYDHHLNHGINLTTHFLEPSYRHILHHCVDWAFDHGHLTRDEYNEYGFTTR
jgi:hypothetical protein